MRKVLSLLLLVATITLLMPVSTFAADKTAAEITEQISNTYSKAKQNAGVSSFNGMCGLYVGRQLEALGINTSYVGANGNREFDIYKDRASSTGGYSITAYPASQYNLKSALNAISNSGTNDVYNILIGFEKGSGEDGALYGHTCFIHAILDGSVYFSESFALTIGGTRYNEGAPIVCSISTFCNYYNGWTELDGLIHFQDGSNYSTIAPGDYRLRNGSSYLTASTALDSSTPLSVSVASNSDAQVFNIFSHPSYNTTYMLKPLSNSSGRVNVWDASSSSNGDAVTLYRNTEHGSQSWVFEKRDDAYLIHPYDNKSLSLTNTNGSTYVKTTTGDSSQLWYLESADTNVNIIPVAGYYKLVPECAPGYCLDAENKTAESGANIVINGSAGNASQFFYVSDLGNGYCALYAGSSTLVLDMENGGSEAGTNVQLWPYNGTIAQQWAFYDGGDGYYCIAPRANISLRLDVDNAWASEGNNVNVWYDNTGSEYRIAQRWQLVPSSSCPYTVTYNANGGSGAPQFQTKSFGQTLILSSSVPTRTGYIFLGWADSATADTAQYQPGSSFTKDADTILYAVWRDENAVVFNEGIAYLDKGWGDDEFVLRLSFSCTEAISGYGVSYLKDSAGNLLSGLDSFNKQVVLNPSSYNCLFCIYSIDGNSSGNIYESGDGRLSEGQTYYWKGYVILAGQLYQSPEYSFVFTKAGSRFYRHTVTYNANGGLNAPASQTKEYLIDLKLSSSVPTRNGYTFLGWAENSDATTATYQAGGSFTKDADTTLYAVWQQDVSNFTYTTDSNGNATITGYTGSETVITIPSSIDGHPVTVIGGPAFRMSNVTNVTIPASVTKIENMAFFSSSLTNVVIPGSVKNIGTNAFVYCRRLTSVIISDGVTTIGSGAFLACFALNSINIPGSVISIGGQAFKGCSNLNGVTVAAENPNYCSEDGILFNKTKTELLFYPAVKTQSSYSIPNSVTSIDVGAFYGCSALT